MPTESTASSILRPHYRLARLFAATAKWQSLTDTANEDAALLTISHPDYRVLDGGNSVRCPLIVISNPIDLEQTFFKKPDAKGRNNFGALLVTFVMLRDDTITNAEPAEQARLQLEQFMDQVGTVCDQALAKSGQLHPSNEYYYQNVETLTLAIAAAECDLRSLSGIARDNEEDSPKPQVVMTCSLVANWI